jgi:nucleotide-binding universal stress UspA family protein
MFTRILVPLDGSAESNVALPIARTFARATGARIRLLRVVSDSTARPEAARFLQRIADELRAGEVAVEAAVREGTRAEQILDEIKAQACDVVIMRTHGRAGIGRVVLGSVTEKIVAASQIPVVLLRPGGRRVSRLRTLLVPLDESPGGALALGLAVGLAQATGTQLRLLEVVVPVANYVYGAYSLDAIGGGYIDPAWDTEAQTAAQTYIDAMTRRLRDRGLQASGEVRVGLTVDETIVAAAEEYAADLIVMSTHALTGPARALLGSVADAVVRKAHCPVLMIHAEPGEQVEGIANRAAAEVPIAP